VRLLLDQLIQPYLTEKTTKGQNSLNEYAIIVDKKLTKTEIKQAVKSVFGVDPIDVRTTIFRKKTRRSRTAEVAPKSYKKALIRLPEGKKLELK
jgi:large subunit ribosomal protein L23